MTTMRTLFLRARSYAPLTPAERALLRLLEGLVCAALVAALPVLAQALSHGAINWADVARAALAAAAVAVLLALAKYARAHGDPVLGQALGGALAASASALAAQAPLPAVSTTLAAGSTTDGAAVTTPGNAGGAADAPAVPVATSIANPPAAPAA
ncbi:MAG: hypothetical protein ACHQ4H_03440 [Ktedonobacterales bacterium]